MSLTPALCTGGSIIEQLLRYGDAKPAAGLHNSSCNSRWGGGGVSLTAHLQLCVRHLSPNLRFSSSSVKLERSRGERIYSPAAVPATACGSSSCKLSQVDGSFHFELLGGAFAGSILELAAVDVRDEAVDLHRKHAVPLWDH